MTKGYYTNAAIEADCDLIDLYGDAMNILMFDFPDGEETFDDEKIEKLNKVGDIIKAMEERFPILNEDRKDDWRQTIDELSERYHQISDLAKSYKL